MEVEEGGGADATAKHVCRCTTILSWQQQGGHCFKRIYCNRISSYASGVLDHMGQSVFGTLFPGATMTISTSVNCAERSSSFQLLLALCGC